VDELERIALAAYLPVYGDDAVRVGDATCLRAPLAPDSPMLNRVIGLGVGGPADPGVVDEALAAMGETSFYVAVSPDADPALDGFTVIVEWLKQHAMRGSDRPVHETIAVFVDRALAVDYLARTVSARELAGRARVMAWDGADALGPISVSAWEDNFVATYKMQNYQLDKGVSCQ